MDVCEIDWGSISTIIAALIASATALCISSKWHGQKGQEVIATESKFLLYNLYELQEHIKLLESNEIKKDVIFQNEIIKFENRLSSIQKSLLFLSKELEPDHQRDIRKLWEYLDKINNKLASYKSKNVLENKLAVFAIALAIYESENKSFWDNLEPLIDQVIEILRNKALYK